MNESKLLTVAVTRLVSAMKWYNYALMEGSFSQWQVALAKYETLRDLLIDSGHTVEFTSKTDFIGTSPRMLFVTVTVDGAEYNVPEFESKGMVV